MTPIDYLKSIGIKTCERIEKIMNEEPFINLDAITIEDCLEMKQFKNRETIINDGKVVDIVYPEYTEKQHK